MCACAHTDSRMRSWHQLTQQATVRSLAGELRIMISTQEAHAQPQAVSLFLFSAPHLSVASRASARPVRVCR
jgi:hypothetical protein